VGKSIIDTSSVTRVGVDLAKRVFRIHAVDATGSVVIARSVNRRALLKFFDMLPRCVVAMEACSSAHHWGRQLLELGFAVKLIPPAPVKPYVRRGKTTRPTRRRFARRQGDRASASFRCAQGQRDIRFPRQHAEDMTAPEAFAKPQPNP